MANIPHIISGDALDALTHTITQWSCSGMHAPDVPPVKGALAPLRDALKQLRKSVLLENEQLLEERARIRQLVDALSEGLLFFDAAGPDATLILCNRAALRLCALTGQVEGGRAQTIGLPAQILSLLSAPLPATLQQTTPDGTVLRLRASCVPTPDGSSTRVLIGVTDITASMHIAAMRRDFVVAASHELKTPVAGMGLLCDTTLMALEDNDVPQARELISSLKHETDHLRVLVSDLLDLSRLEEGTSTHENTDIRRAIATELLTRKRRAAEQGLELIWDDTTEAREPVEATIPHADFVIILDNLLENALAYTDTGTISVRLDAAKSAVKLVVADTGCGIAPADCTRIFERFYRPESSRSRALGGSGLGLALVKHAAQRNGGSVEVESKLGEGTRFSVTLPRVPQI